jgi:hypothetical protein
MSVCEHNGSIPSNALPEEGAVGEDYSPLIVRRALALALALLLVVLLLVVAREVAVATAAPLALSRRGRAQSVLGLDPRDEGAQRITAQHGTARHGTAQQNARASARAREPKEEGGSRKRRVMSTRTEQDPSMPAGSPEKAGRTLRTRKKAG